MTPKKNRRPMSTAPRDGTTIIIGDNDCGEYPMRWNPEFKNPLIPGVVGFWVSPLNSFTWDESRGFGPTYWAPDSH